MTDDDAKADAVWAKMLAETLASTVAITNPVVREVLKQIIDLGLLHLEQHIPLISDRPDIALAVRVRAEAFLKNLSIATSALQPPTPPPPARTGEP